MCKCTPEIRTPYCGVGNCQWPNGLKGLNLENSQTGQYDASERCRIEKQGVISMIEFPTFQDEIAVSKAIKQLLSEGWTFEGVNLSQRIVLRRVWEA